MGKNPWEDPDPEVAALAASMRTKSPKRWLRLAVGLLVVAMLTFIAAYYVPLFRAHASLRDEFKELSERRRTLDETLETRTRELERVQGEKAALQAKLDERDKAEERHKADLEKLKTSLSSSLRDKETRGTAAVRVEQNQVRVALANDLVFSPHTLTIGNGGTRLLCEIAGESDGAELRVVSVTSASERPAVLLKTKYPGGRELSAARAAVVGNRLERNCKVPAERVQAVGIVASGDDASGVKLPALVLELSPSEK